MMFKGFEKIGRIDPVEINILKTLTPEPDRQDGPDFVSAGGSVEYLIIGVYDHRLNRKKCEDLAGETDGTAADIILGDVIVGSLCQWLFRELSGFGEGTEFLGTTESDLT